jgi:hypothetical protein
MMDDFVVTPYFRTIALVSPNTCVEEPSANYNPYNLFCLSQKLASQLIRLRPTFRPQLVSQEIQGRMVITVYILDGETRVSLSPSDRDHLQTLVNTAVSDNPEYCPLISIDLPGYPSAWLRSILPYLSLPQVLNPYVADGILYITIAADIDYQMVYSTMSRSVGDQIANLYTSGTIVCDANFARTWRLTSLYRSSGNPWSPGTPNESPKISLNRPEITAPTLIGDTVMQPGYEHVLNDWDSTLSTSRTGSGSRRETERTVAVLRQFFDTGSAQESLNTGIELITGFHQPTLNPSIPSVADDVSATGLETDPGVMPTGIPANLANTPVATALGVNEGSDITVSELTEFNTREGNNYSASDSITDAETILADQEVAVRNSTYDNTGLGLYLAPWRDDRMAPDRTRFLLERLHGHNSLAVEIGWSYPVRHFIARALQSILRALFIGSTLILPATSYDQLITLIGRVYRAKAEATGRVAILPIVDPTEATALEAAALRRWPSTTTALYDVDNPIKPLIFSWQVPLDTELETAQEELLDAVETTTLTHQ